MGDYEKIQDKPNLHPQSPQSSSSESYQALPSALGSTHTSIPSFPSSALSQPPVRPAPKAQDYKPSTYSQYNEQTIEFRREGDSIVVWGKTFDVKDIFKTFSVATWNKDTKMWILSGMGSNIEHIIFFLDTLKEMQRRKMIRSTQGDSAGKQEKK